MKQEIDYVKLMHASSEVGNESTCFIAYRDGDKPKLSGDGHISFLFVLQGGLICVFDGNYTTKLNAQQMMVVDKNQLRELQCVGDTVILECVESDNMSPLMQATSRAFSIPCSEIITMNIKIKAWCENMFTDLIDNPNPSNDYCYSRCRELTALLLEYPRGVLGTLYIPLYACSKHCDRCTRLFVRSDGVVTNR